MTRVGLNTPRSLSSTKREEKKDRTKQKKFDFFFSTNSSEDREYNTRLDGSSDLLRDTTFPCFSTKT